MLTLFPTLKSYRRGIMLTLSPSLKSFGSGNDRLLRNHIDHTLRGYFNRAHGNTPPLAYSFICVCDSRNFCGNWRGQIS